MQAIIINMALTVLAPWLGQVVMTAIRKSAKDSSNTWDDELVDLFEKAGQDIDFATALKLAMKNVKL